MTPFPRLLPRTFACSALLSLLGLTATAAEPRFPAQFIPQPGAVTDQPYAPQALLPGGIVIPLYAPDSPELNPDRVHEAELYEMDPHIPGRVRTMSNVHNPSIEVHPVAKNTNTGAALIIIAGGGNKRLFVGSEACDIVSHFSNYGVTGIILRVRLRADGYNAEIDSVNDTLQAIRLVRHHAAEWGIDPRKIGVMGFSAGGEQASGAALRYPDFDRTHHAPGDPLAGVSARPDFAALIYTGPSALTHNPDLPIPADMPPSFIASASYGHAVHTVWSLEYYLPMLKHEVPHIELHLYGNGGHGGGVTDRGGIPYGTWSARFIDWFRDLGFLQKPGVPTKVIPQNRS